MSGLDELEGRITTCRRCPRLVEWRERVAREKRASFASEEYWGRPLPGEPSRRHAVRRQAASIRAAAIGATASGSRSDLNRMSEQGGGRWLPPFCFLVSRVALGRLVVLQCRHKELA